MPETTSISLRLPDDDLTAIDELVDAGVYKTRSAFLLSIVHDALVSMREQIVAEQYRRAYADQPLADDETWAISARDHFLKDSGK